MDDSTCPGCQALRVRVAQLEAQLAELARRLEDALRAGKRQAAPFRKGPPKSKPRTPGRKAGIDHGDHGHRPLPDADHVSECHDAPLPEACPHCQGTLVETGTAEQFQTEIPRQSVIRQFTVHVGQCRQCGRRVQGRHALQTSDALGAAASQVGPDAQAAATVLHTRLGLSHGKVAALFDSLFGINLTRGASAQINLRAANRLEPSYATILDAVRGSEHIAADETGWRVGGRPAWLHVWVADLATAYAIDPRRSAEVLERVIGTNWDGVLSHDGFSSYGRFTEAVHQQCAAHVVVRARELLQTATRGAARFPRQVLELFTTAVHQRNLYRRGELSLEALQARREEFDDRLEALTARPRASPENERFAKHLWQHSVEWFAFVTDPLIEATNWQAEQALRPAVVNRKVWGGNRTTLGAQAQGVLMSVLETCQRQARAALDFVSQTLRAAGNRILPPPVILLPR